MQKKLISFLSLCLFAITNVQSQSLEEYLINDFQFDSVQLMNNSIKSIHVYSERINTYKRTDETKVSTKKLVEIELNAFGQKVYQRNTRSKFSNSDLGGGKTAYQSYEYDDQNRVILERESEGMESTRSFSTTFTKDGHIASKRDVYGDYQENVTEFHWLKDSLIDLTFTQLINDKQEERPRISFDQTGRITEYKIGARFFIWNRTLEGKYRIVDSKHFNNDTLVHHSFAKIINNTLKPVLTYRLNKDLDTTETSNAKYDEFGNLTFLRYRKWETIYDADEEYEFDRHNEDTYIEEIVYKIENFYVNGLLNKRNIIGTKTKIKGEQETSRGKFTKTERFHYDNQPLPSKYWPEKEVEEDSFDDTKKDRITVEEIIEVEGTMEEPPAPEIPAKIDDY